MMKCMAVGERIGRLCIGTLAGSRWITVIFAVVAAASVSAGALAQGSNIPLVPEAITTPELKRYSDLLGLSTQQRLAAFELHDAHKQRYREMQQRDIKELMDQIIAIGMRFMANQLEIPSREEVKRIVSTYRGILNKANRLDTEFFASLTPLLSEEQLQQVPTITRRREMHLYEELVVEAVRELNRGASVDLIGILEELELSPEELERTAVIREQYEAARLRRMRDGVDLMEQLVDTVLTAIDELGLRTLTPERMMELGQDQRFIDDVQNRFNELSKPFQAAAWDASQLNVSTHRQLSPLLTPKNAWELRDRYYRNAYRRVYDGPGDWRRRYNEALHIAEVTEEQLSTIRAQRAHYDRTDAQLVDAIVQELEKSRRYRTFARFDGAQPDPVDEKITDYRTRRDSLHQSAADTLDGLLGPQIVAQLNEKLKEADEEVRVREGSQMMVASDSGAVSVSVAVGSFERSTPPEEAFRPYAMTANEMKMFEQFLGVKEEQRDVVRVVFDAYRERHDRMRQVRSAEDEDADAAAPSEQVRAAQGVFDSLLAADDSFFEDLELVVGADASRYVRWMRQFRARASKTRLSRSLSPTWGDDEAYLDVAGILINHTQADQLPAQVDSLLAEYHGRVMPLINDRASAASEVHRRRVTVERMRSSDNAPQDLAERMQQQMQEASAKVWQQNRSLIAVNRESLEQLLTVLDESSAWDVRWEYYRAAYPQIFDERSSALKFFEAALELPDVADTQRQRISDLLVSYRRDYFSASEEMVALRQGRDFDFNNFQMPTPADIERELRLEQLRFDRREAANRAKYRLQLVLSDDQVDRIPELRLLQ